jgi:tRNA (adenine57-N1/adenine58-N1)-methyltransferase
LLRAVGQSGRVDSFERRKEFADIATKNVSHYFGTKPENWSLTLGSVQEATEQYDRIILDMLAPWECIELAERSLTSGGVFMAYVATTTQLSNVAEAIKASGQFTEPESMESLVRPWHHEGLAVRPVHRMIGHTGFLIFARKLAPGTVPPLRRRRPSKGAYGLPESEVLGDSE